MYAVDETTAVAFVLIVNPVVVILTQTACAAAKLAVAAKKPGKMGQRARLAQTLKGFKK